MNTTNDRNLCLALIRADSEAEVIALLRRAGLWDRQEAWRHYGDVENYWATIGNQQSSPEAALVENWSIRSMHGCSQPAVKRESIRRARELGNRFEML